MTTEQIIAEVRRVLELEQRATPGPWRSNYERVTAGPMPVALCRGILEGPIEQGFCDAHLIASLRNLAPRLALLESALAVCASASVLMKLRDKQLAMSDDYTDLREALAAHHAMLRAAPTESGEV